MTHDGEPDLKCSREEGLQGLVCLFVCLMRLELRKKQKIDGDGKAAGMGFRTVTKRIRLPGGAYASEGSEQRHFQGMLR